MNEENREKSVEMKNADGSRSEIVSADKKFNRKPMYAAFAIIGAVLLGALLMVLFRNSTSGGGGQVVPPPRTVSFDEGGNQENPAALPAEQTVTIAPEQIERIGIKIETAGETMSSEAAQIAATGVVQANAYAETPVISLVGGIVRRIDAQLGENVNRGQTIAVVFSDELAAAQARYLALQTETQTARQVVERAAQLVRLNPTSRAELDEATAKLKTAEAELEEHHKHHERTEKLIRIGAASREEFEQATTKLKTAEAETERARRQVARAAEVARLNPVSRRELEEAIVKLRTNETELANTRQRLLLLGLSEQRLAALRSPAQISSEVALSSPISGTITSRSVNQGEVVEANKELLKVTNLASVWVIAQIYEKDLGRIRRGSGASVTTDAYPGRVFRGQVTYIDPNINQETRTAQARVELENPGQMLKIGMYVNVSFGALGTGEKTSPVVPASAVQILNNQKIVFAATEQSNVFVMKPVRTGAEIGGGLLVISEGLNVGDKIVTDGSFLLRAEVLKRQ